MKLLTVLLLVCSFSLFADNLVFDRGLPTTNLNDAAGADRSNVAWGDYTPYSAYPPSNDVLNWAIGDDFNLGLDGTYHVDDLRVWIVGLDGMPLDDMWSDLTLFTGGTTADSIAVQPTLGTGVTQVTYVGDQNYQGSSGGYISIYQVDFLLDWWINGNTTYTFFVAGTPKADNISAYPPGVSPFLSASNKDKSGSTQQGADNLFREIGFNNSNVVQYSGLWDSLASPDCTLCGGWDKSSDVNVQVFVPEPSAILILGAFAGALGGLGAFLRKRR